MRAKALITRLKELPSEAIVVINDSENGAFFLNSVDPSREFEVICAKENLAVDRRFHKGIIDNPLIDSKADSEFITLNP